MRPRRAQTGLQSGATPRAPICPFATHRSVDSSTLQEAVTTQVLKGGGIATPAMQASKGVSVGASDGILVVSCLALHASVRFEGT